MNLIFSLFFIQAIVFGVEGMLQCYKCNSNDLEKCATKPGKDLPHVICEKNQDACITKINDDGYVIRDCINKNEINHDQQNEICEDAFCNINIFPKKRLECIICKGEDCSELSNKHHPQICPIYKKNDKCFTQVIDETDVVRDCKSTSGYLPPFAVECSGNGCNRHNKHVEVSCLECSSIFDKNCKSLNPKTKTCKFNILLGRPEESCFTYHKYDKVIRGCFRDSGILQLEEDFFKSCKGDECNNKAISIPKCIECGPGTKDPNCENNKIVNCQENISSCHACLLENNVQQRGCGNPPKNNENNKNINCYECQGEDQCNIKPFRKCFKCNSKTNPNCTGPLNLSKTDIEICPSSESSCLTTINIFGHTERGCLSEEFNEEHKIRVEKCQGNLCNMEIFPKKRLHCFKCNGNDECGLKQDENLSEPCTIYSNTDSCFEFIKDGTQIFRGCKSDPEYDNCLKNSQHGCYQCIESNCNNNLVVVKKPQNSCYTCSENDKKCGWTQDNNNLLKTCKTNIPLNATENCYSYKLNDGKIRRGCSWDDDICLEGNTPNCVVCENDACNNKVLVSEKCVQIDLEHGVEEGLQPILCTAEKQTYDTRGCYISREVLDNSLSFGCISDLTTEQLNKCKNNPKTCNTCTDDACNNIKIPEPQGKQPRLDCYKCNNEDEHCQWKQNKYSIPCKKYIPINETETCFTRRDSEGRIERGCSYDRNLCLNSSEDFCEVCDTSNCNSKLLIPQKCIQEIYNKNEKKESDLKNSTCEVTEQYWTNQGCYVIKNETQIKWGCIADLSKEDFKKCTADITKCNYCKGDDCASMKIPNSAFKMYSATLISILSLLINLN